MYIYIRIRGDSSRMGSSQPVVKAKSAKRVCFRHHPRDGLSAVQRPSDMIDQIGGWSTAGVGKSYGERYGLTAPQSFSCKFKLIIKSSNILSNALRGSTKSTRTWQKREPTQCLSGCFKVCGKWH